MREFDLGAVSGTFSCTIGYETGNRTSEPTMSKRGKPVAHLRRRAFCAAVSLTFVQQNSVDRRFARFLSNQLVEDGA
jgi:hypothetical protein